MNHLSANYDQLVQSNINRETLEKYKEDMEEKME